MGLSAVGDLTGMMDSLGGTDARERTDDSCSALLGCILACVGTVRDAFDRWEDPQAKGPGLYFVVGTDTVAEFVEPMGSNRWPVDDCASVFDAPAEFAEAARRVAISRDGAVVVHEDGRIEAPMVRVAQLSQAERRDNGTLDFAGWMGARHMSALETSTRGPVRAVVTLSEEDGRMTVFRDGSYEDFPRGSGTVRRSDGPPSTGSS